MKADFPTRNLVQEVSQPSALLDIRFNNEEENKTDILATVSSTGTLAIFKLEPTDKLAPLQHLATSRCDDLSEDVLFLQCKWHPTLSNVLAVTTSTGSARFLYLNDQWEISQYADVNIANSLEAWSIAISPSSTQPEDSPTQTTVYCGGDDSILRYTSCAWTVGDRSPIPEEQYSPTMIKGKHDAGVTAILPLDLSDGEGGRVVITGSYDDCLRVFVIHDLHTSYGERRVEQVLEQNLGGGVWRLDLIGLKKDGNKAEIKLLASCMHAGARVLDLSVGDSGLWSLKVLARFEEHKSMNYASDFSSSGLEKLTCVSSSFYDRLLCLWECDVE